MKTKISLGDGNKVAQPASVKKVKRYLVEEIQETAALDHIYQRVYYNYFHSRGDALAYRDRRVRNILSNIDFKEGIELKYNDEEEQVSITYNGSYETITLGIYKQLDRTMVRVQ